MNIAIAIVLGALLIAAAVAVSHRYAIAGFSCNVTSDICSHAWILDNWTGRVSLCEYAPSPRNVAPACIKASGDLP
jgi:hypothetical protein